MIGYYPKDNVKQNIVDAETRDADIQFSQEILEYYKNGFRSTLRTENPEWYNFAEKIVYMPAVKFNGGANLKYMFSGTDVGEPMLRVFPPSDANVSNMTYMFYGCHNLESVGLLNCVDVYTINTMFGGNYNLRYLGGFKNLGNNINTNSSLANGTLDFRAATKLTKESILNVFNTIGTRGPSAKQCTILLCETCLQELSADDIAIATNKGWTVSS